MLAISAGDGHTCAVTASRTVLCWGDDTAGEIGDGKVSWAIPVDVPTPALGLAPNVLGVTAAFNSTCAFTVAGGLSCWGLDDYGQLGDGMAQPSVVTPVAPVGVPSVVAVAGGRWSTCALLGSGKVMCWGANDAGALDIGSMVSPSLPGTVLGL